MNCRFSLVLFCLYIDFSLLSWPTFPPFFQIQSGAKTPFEKWLLNFAIEKKHAEVKRGIIRNNSIWDKLIFHKVQVFLSGIIYIWPQWFSDSTNGTFLSPGSSLSNTGEESIEMVMKPATDLDLECLYVSLAPGISWGIHAGDRDRCCSHFTCSAQLPQSMPRLPGEEHTLVSSIPNGCHVMDSTSRLPS